LRAAAFGFWGVLQPLIDDTVRAFTSARFCICGTSCGPTSAEFRVRVGRPRPIGADINL